MRLIRMVTNNVIESQSLPFQNTPDSADQKCGGNVYMYRYYCVVFASSRTKPGISLSLSRKFNQRKHGELIRSLYSVLIRAHRLSPSSRFCYRRSRLMLVSPCTKSYGTFAKLQYRELPWLGVAMEITVASKANTTIGETELLQLPSQIEMKEVA